MGIAEACVVERSRVPEELFCQVCMDLVSGPVQTATDHIFCRDCLSRALAVQAVCPVTRRPLQNNASDVRALDVANPVMHRVWSKVRVRCPNTFGGCTWRGGPADMGRHLEGCRPCRADAEALEGLRMELASEREAAERRERKLKAEIDRLKAQLQRHTSFDATYSYGRERIVELAQVILRDLEGPPRDINTNRIFDCVRTIQRDWERCWTDNPEHMRMDFEMLLSVCVASTWFTKKQRDHLRDWQESL
jgi:hypothetical protein